MTLMQSSIPHLKSLKEQGSKGRRKIIQYSRYVTVIIAALARLWSFYWIRINANCIWKYCY